MISLLLYIKKVRHSKIQVDTMKKEVFIAVLIGLSLGLIITYGVYRFRTALTSKPVTNLELAATPTPDESIPTVLAWHNPEAGSVQTDTAVTITGTTIPSTFIVVFINNQDFVTTTDETGNFSIQTDLNEGGNIIRLHVVEESGEAVTEERVVIVSTALENNDEGPEKESQDE
jgi:hypothetical protein